MTLGGLTPHQKYWGELLLKIDKNKVTARTTTMSVVIKITAIKQQ